MKTDLDTLLIALYVLVDDHVIPAEGRRRPGRPKKLTDAELAYLAVAQVLLGARSEHHWMRTCHARLWHLFPYLPNQPGYHKRVKAAAPLIYRAPSTWPRCAHPGPTGYVCLTPPRCRAAHRGKRYGDRRWPGWPVTVTAPRTRAGTGG
jgi:hypothetical protein